MGKFLIWSVGLSILVMSIISFFKIPLSFFVEHVGVVLSIITLIVGSAGWWFGLFGNYETKRLLKIKEDELDREAFDFLTNAPGTIIMGMDDSTSLLSSPAMTSRMFISNFEKKVLPHNINSKKYKRYILLANDITRFPILHADFDVIGRRQIYDKIENEASLLRCKLDQQTGLVGMQTLWSHAESILWEKKIFICEPEQNSEVYKKVLIYTDTPQLGDTEENLRNLINSYYIEKYNLPHSDTFYKETSNASISNFTVKKYELIKIQDNYIRILLKGKKITLYYNKPKSTIELNLNDREIN